jgi:site-specific DNA recombinase
MPRPGKKIAETSEANRKAVCYTRVSTGEQGTSMKDQREKLLAYCTLKGLEAVKDEYKDETGTRISDVIADEGVSGGIPLAERAGGMRMLRILERKEVANVVALKLDRLFRSAKDCLNVVDDWAEAGISLHFVDFGGAAFDTSSTMGHFFLTVTAGFAELERGMIADRVTAALQYKKGHHQVYTSVPYGFDAVGEPSKPGKPLAGMDLVPNPAEQEALVKMKSWREAGWGLRKVVAELRHLGIPAKEGGEWDTKTLSVILKKNGITGRNVKMGRPRKMEKQPEENAQ